MRLFTYLETEFMDLIKLNFYILIVGVKELNFKSPVHVTDIWVLLSWKFKNFSIRDIPVLLKF
jgi:hypothetical protein